MALPKIRSYKMLKSLRKFGLEYCDLSTMISNVAFLLRMSIINVDRRYQRQIPIIYYFTTILTGACYLYVFVISMFWFVFVRCRETGDKFAASVIFSIAACSITGVAKLIYIRIYNDAIKDIVDEYLACDTLVEPSSRFSKNLLKALRVVKRRAVSFWLFLTINGITYISAALIRPGRHFTEDMIVIYGLEPMFESPNYDIAFTMILAGIYFGIPSVTNTSALFIILAGYAEAQMLALSEELDNLWDDAKTSHRVIAEVEGNEDFNNHKVLNEYIRKQLRDIAKKHIMSIKLLGRVEYLFRGAMAVEFGCLASGLIAELLGGLENTYLQMPYTLLQVALDCFLGQRLIDASLVFENAVYSCNWENFDKSNQKTVYLMLLNSQKTLTLSVGGLTILSFSCLMSVLKSIYSAYTTLRSRM